MEIAVSERGFHFVAVADGEADPGHLTGLQFLALVAEFRLERDPFNVVFRRHGMQRLSNADIDLAVVHIVGGQVFFRSGILRIGNQLLRFFPRSRRRARRRP